MTASSSVKARKKKMAWADEIDAAFAESATDDEERRKLASASVKATNLKLKREVFAEYGGKCDCCGERHEEFLTLDHVGGWKVTPKLTNHHYSEYRALRKSGYPKGKFRVLCMNCNFAVRGGKLCPHESEKKAGKRVTR